MGGKVLEYEEKDILRRGIMLGLCESYISSFIEGYKAGFKKGADNKQTSLVQTMLRKGKSPEIINEFTDIPISYITNVQKQMMVMEESKYNS